MVEGPLNMEGMMRQIERFHLSQIEAKIKPKVEISGHVEWCEVDLYWSQISKVVFGASDEQRGFQKLGTQLHPKTQVVKGVLAEQAADLMVRFFASKRQ